MQLAISLRAYRRTHHLTQKEIAVSLGVSREYYSRLECGKTQPSLRLLQTICHSTDISAANFFGKSARKLSRNEITEMCKLCLRMRASDREKIQWLIRRMLKR
jgi:transcriptional regulator with XRE-family HTH domain